MRPRVLHSDLGARHRRAPRLLVTSALSIDPTWPRTRRQRFELCCERRLRIAPRCRIRLSRNEIEGLCRIMVLGRRLGFRFRDRCLGPGGDILVGRARCRVLSLRFGVPVFESLVPLALLAAQLRREQQALRARFGVEIDSHCYAPSPSCSTLRDAAAIASASAASRLRMSAPGRRSGVFTAVEPAAGLRSADTSGPDTAART